MKDFNSLVAYQIRMQRRLEELNELWTLENDEDKRVQMAKEILNIDLGLKLNEAVINAYPKYKLA